ncbi:Cna B-type domain-containing protein [Enterococcus gilvus]|uniref:Cna B-type domain-containing protein n=1 Tax=Enterococcus gilvus TaxID=160453 RepID=UPI00345EF61A
MDREVKIKKSVILLIVLLLNTFVGPIVAIAETSSAQPIEKLTIRKLEISPATDGEQYAEVQVGAAVDNPTDQEKTFVLSLSEPVELINDAQKEFSTLLSEDKKQVTIHAQPKTTVEGNIRLRVNKGENERSFKVHSANQEQEVTIPPLTIPQSTSSSKEPTKESSESTTVTSASTSEQTTTTSTTTQESSKEKEKSVASKKAATLAERESVDIKTLFKGNEKFLSDVKIEVFNGNVPIDYEHETVPSDATIKLSYNWEIPQRLIDEKLIKGGDYYETKLPDNLKVRAQSGELKNSSGVVYGNYTISADGKVRWTFNQKVEQENDISGTLFYAEQLKEENNAGETTIKVPLDEGTKEIKVTVRPNGGNSISKLGAKGSDNRSIRWDISINTNLNVLKNATVTDPLPEGLNLADLKIYPQEINLKGEVVNVGTTPLVEGTDYTREGNVVTFIGNYAETAKSFKLVYQTTVDENKIPYEGGELSFKNTATITNGTDVKSADAQVKLQFGKLISKSNGVRDTTENGQVYKWKIAYNQGYKKLPAGSYVKDTLVGDYAEFVKGSVVVKTVSGTTLVEGTDYSLVFDEKSMTVTFLKEVSTAITIDYKTKLTVIVDDNFDGSTLKNEVITDGGYKGSGSGTIEKNGVVKDASVDYQNRKINWTITVNRFNYDMLNWKLEDTMSDGLVFNKESFKIFEQGSKTPLHLGVDYEFVGEPTDKKFNVQFIGALADPGTNKTYVISYATDFAREQEKFTNTAVSKWKDADGKDHQNTGKKDQIVTKNYVVDASKGGEYNAQTKRIKWTTIVNYNQQTLKNATISDPILGEQTYVPNSAKLYEVTINPDGSIKLGTEVANAAAESAKTVSANLPDGSTKAYALVFETSLEGSLITDKPYLNKATFQNDGKSKTVEASVKASNGGSYAVKSGEQDSGNMNYVNWSVVINPSQSTLDDVVITDEPSVNQVIDQASIKIFETVIDAAGNISKNTNKTLEQGKDYSVDVQTDNETGKQVATIKLLKTINTAYMLEYRSLINSSLLTDEVTNKISIKGMNEKTIQQETTTKQKVIVSGGSAQGSAASVTLVKIDKNKGENAPLAGAKLELWTRDEKGNKAQLVRSGTTDEKGELKFGNLRANYDYLLIETQAPDGFTVSQELRDGKVVRFNPDTETAQFAEMFVENDLPRISFKKVDGETKKGLSGAVFAIKNAKGDYYNGVTAANKVQWVSSEDKISEEVAKSLTSDATGTVTVTGLKEGTYSIKEISAPHGYDRVTQEQSFELINDQGVIKLTQPIQDIANEKTQYVNVPIKKIWDDANNQDGKRPEKIAVTLVANGKPTKKTLTVTASANWSGAFENLEKYDEAKKEILYSVKESDVPDYELTSISPDGKGGFEVTNSHKAEVISVQGKKVWDDADNQDGKRPEKITVNLFADGKFEQSKDVSEKTNWAYEFINLPKFKDGKEINYSVKESSVTDYTTTITDFTITNKYVPGKTSVSATKHWDDSDNQDGLRPEKIHLQLYGDGLKVGKEVALSQENDWSTTWNDLPVKSKGKEIQYTVGEVGTINGYKGTVEEIAKGTFALTNSHTPETTQVTGTKTWKDKNNQNGLRPASIHIRLLADGKEVAEKEVRAETGWTYQFTDLPKYQDGKKISYAIQEDRVSHYSTTVNGFDLINSYTPKRTSINVLKVWDDFGDQEGLRPERIRVQLFADGKQMDKELVLTKATNWQGDFSDLPLSSQGKTIHYTIKEVSIKSYKATITGNQDQGYVLTNTHVPPAPSSPKNHGGGGHSFKGDNSATNYKTSLPRTGEKGSRTLLILGLVLVVAAGIFRYRIRAKKS